MHFLAGTWWVWLIVCFVVFLTTLVICLEKMKEGTLEPDDSKAFFSIFLGMIILGIGWIISVASFVLFILGGIAALLGK